MKNNDLEIKKMDNPVECEYTKKVDIQARVLFFSPPKSETLPNEEKTGVLINL